MNPTDVEKLMIEAIANSEELVQYTLERIEQPPRGPADEVGHFRTLNNLKMNAKQRDALRIALEEVAFNVAVSIFALIDNEVETEVPGFPKLSLVNQATNKQINKEPLNSEFQRLWNEGADGTIDVDDE